MSRLKLRLLGAPQIEQDGALLELNRHKAMALLAYLAVTSEAHSRDKIAAMLWPDSEQSRASLRRDLSVLNKYVGDGVLAIERETIGIEHGAFWLDVAEFRGKIAACGRHGHPADTVCAACIAPLTEAAGLYHDRFMAGFSLRDAPEFDEWQFFQADELQQEFALVLQKLIEAHVIQQNYTAALPYGRRWVALDPLHEPAQRQLMMLYAQNGQQSAALRQYQLAAELLEDELGVPPADETVALYERIRQMPSGRAPTSFTIAPASQPTLPLPATPFIGRVAGIAAVTAQLSDPACRLLTLNGPGGVGKTRMALQVAHHLGSDQLGGGGFADGVYYAPLAAVHTAGELVTAIGGALHFSFYRESDPHTQLLNFLRPKKLLLVLDNFEQLLAADEAVALVTQILETAPEVKLLVTSQESLNLLQELVYPVEGMRYPAADEGAGLEHFSAVQLFVQSAQRVRPEFSLAAEQACVRRICQLVEGLPLALELAAAWLKVLSCQEIAQEIERNLDFLTTSLRNIPARHRSMGAVFAYSWAMLTEQEQKVLCRLSLFRGGFTQAAAVQVAGASLLDLTGLMEKSLVQLRGNGRYRMHGLLRQFIAAKLDELPTEKAAVQQAHARYFAEFIADQAATFESRKQAEASAQIAPEIKNIRLAWRQMAQAGETAVLLAMIDPLYQFFMVSSQFQDGLDLFLGEVGESAELAMKLTIRQGAFAAQLGRYGLARERLQEGLSLGRQLDAPREVALALDLLGTVLHIQGESLEAVPLYEKSLAISRQTGDFMGAANSIYNLGWVGVRHGVYDEAQSHFQEALRLYQQLWEQSGIAHALDSLGMSSFFLGAYSEAENYFEQSLTIFQTLNDRLGMARAIGGVGLVSWGEGDLVEAERQLSESLAMNRAIGHQLEVARRLAYLGAVANRQGEYDAAEGYLLEALAISREMGFAFGVPWSLEGLGTAALGKGQRPLALTHLREALELALTAQDMPIVLDCVVAWVEWLVEGGAADLAHIALLLTAVIEHPACWQIIKDRAYAVQLQHGILTAETSELPPVETLVMNLLTEGT